MIRAGADSGAGVVRVSRPAGFAIRGPDVTFARDSRGFEVMVAVDGRLTGRDRLRHALGHSRQVDRNDAELLMDAYQEWGLALVDRIDGAYAAAIWDSRQPQLMLVADLIGVKGWFYRPGTDGGLLFATSVRALLAHPTTTARIDADGLNELLAPGPVYTPGHGILSGVHRLPPGCFAQAVHGRVSTVQYRRWHADPYVHDVETSTMVVRRMLADATLNLRERPAGAVLLSGGIASAAAAAFTTPPATFARPAAAYTLAFTGPWQQPPGAAGHMGAAARTAAHLCLHHRTVTADTTEILAAAAAARQILDTPGDPMTDLPLLTLMRNVAAETSSVVSGVGASALFGDYPWLHHVDVLASGTFPWQLRELAPTDLLNRDALQHLLPDVYVHQRYLDAADAVSHVDGDDATGRAHRRAAHLTLTHYLPARMRRLDQFAAATGLTVHSPYADRALAQYLYTVPYRVRHLLGIGNGLLRHTVTDLLPASVTWRHIDPAPNAGLLPGWRHSLRRQLQHLLADPSQPLQPLLDRTRIADLLRQPAERIPRGWHNSVARLLDVNAWLDRHHVALT